MILASLTGCTAPPSAQKPEARVSREPSTSPPGSFYATATLVGGSGGVNLELKLERSRPGPSGETTLVAGVMRTGGGTVAGRWALTAVLPDSRVDELTFDTWKPGGDSVLAGRYRLPVETTAVRLTCALDTQGSASTTLTVPVDLIPSVEGTLTLPYPFSRAF